MKKVLPLAVLACLVLLTACTSNSTNSNLNNNPSTQPASGGQLASLPSPTAQPSPLEKPQPRESGDAIIISTRANLREKPNASSVVVIELAQDAQLGLVQPKPTGAWYNVRDLVSGKSGWIHGNEIKLMAQPSAEASASPSQPEEGNTAGSSSDTYTNVDGEQVQRPKKSATAPPGASARCADGTYSFSRHRRGTCSHHGGVAQWL